VTCRQTSVVPSSCSGTPMNIVKSGRKFKKDDRGASLAEYALLLALIALACYSAMAILGTSIANFMNTMSSTI
jgi:Flp pilus assembly pilin Flp